MIEHDSFSESTKRLLSLPDGSLAGYGSDNHIKIWNVFDKKCTSILSGHSDSITSLVLVSSSHVASASKDCTVRLWDIHKKEAVQVFQGHYGNVNCLAVIDKELIVSGSDDKTIKIWDSCSGSSLMTLIGHTSWVISLIVLENGNIVSCSWDSTIRIWNPIKGEAIQVISTNSNHLFNFNENLISSINIDQTIKIWNTDSGKCIQTLKGHISLIYCLIFVNKTTIATGSFDKTIKVWNIETGECLRTLKGHSGKIRSLILLGDGSLVSASDDKLIKIWDIEKEKCLETLSVHKGDIYDLTLLENEYLASCSEDKTIKIWDVSDYSNIGTCLNFNYFNECIYSKEGQKFGVHDYLLSKNPLLKNVKILNYSSDLIEKFVEFLYFFDIKKFDNSILVKLLEISIKFKIKNLEDFCYSNFQIDFQTIYFLTESAFRSNFDQLWELCVNFFFKENQLSLMDYIEDYDCKMKMKRSIPKFIQSKPWSKNACRRELRLHMFHLFDRQELTDVTFIDPKTNEEISAHCGYLSTISYFDSLFKFNKNSKKIIKMEGNYSSLRYLKIILNFIYSKKANLQNEALEDLMNVYEFSDQILFNYLKNQVVHCLVKNVNQENAGKIIQFCRNYSIEGNLLNAAQKYFNSITICQMFSDMKKDESSRVVMLENELKETKKELKMTKFELESMKFQIEELKKMVLK
eukprot:gene1733-502_t